MKKGLVSKLGATAVVLTLVTASLVGGTFARYTKEVIGTASVKVAKFNLDTTDVATLDFGLISPIAKTTTQEIVITSDSDVAVEGSLEVTLGTGLPTDWASMTIQEKGGQDPAKTLVAGTASTLTFTMPAATADTPVEKTYELVCVTTEKDVTQQDAKTVSVNVKVTGGQSQ